MTKEQAAKQFAERLLRFPYEEQLVISYISKNIINGCSWEFVRRDRALEENRDKIINNPNTDIFDVSYNTGREITKGYLVYMNLKYNCDLLNANAPGLIDSATLDKALKHREEAVVNLAKKIQKGFKGRIGIFCTNDSQTITVSGKVFPAYAITLAELGAVLSKLNYGIIADGAVRPMNQVMKNQRHVLSNLTVAPSSNALFVDIAPLK